MRLGLGSAALAAALAASACQTGRDGLRPAHPLVPTPEQAFRATAPEPGAPRPFEPPLAEVSVLENGLTLVLVPRPGAALAGLTLVTRAGGEDGPIATAGLSWLLGQALTTGTTSDEPFGAHAFEQQGITHRVVVQRDRAQLAASLPSSRLAEVLPVLAEVATAPTLAAEEVEEVRRSALARIAGALGTPSDRAWYHGARMLHGEGARRGLPIWGSATVLRSASRQALAEHHRRTWRPADSALVVVGDFEPEALAEVARGAFGGWRAEPGPPEPRSEVPSPFEGARVLAVPSLSHAAEIVLMERAPSRTSPDHAPFGLLARVLGGMFASRLNLLLREQRGASYGFAAVYESDREGGELAVFTQVSQDRVREALLAIVAELGRLRDEGPTEDELETARAMALSRLAADLEDCARASVLLADLFAVGQGPEDLAAREAAIRAASLSDIRQVARRWLRPAEAPIVVTGNLGLLELELEGSGLGQVAVER